MAAAVQFMVLDLESGNAVAHYDTWDAAEEAIQVAAESHPEQVEILAVVSYDKEGYALDTRLASDFLGASA